MDPALKELMEGGGEDEVEAIVRLDPDGGLPPHVRVVARFGEIATVRLPRERIAETWADESVVSLKAARPFGLDPDPLPFDAAPEAAEAFDDAGDERRPAGLDATGRGVIVAVLDWGFDFAHPNFRRRDGSTRALALWDQSAPGSGPRPYGYGRVHSREEIDRALRHDEPYRALGYHPAAGDPTGGGAHGTHVLDIAAGNGRAEGAPVGIAPEADLLFVHLATRGTEGRANLGDSVTLLEALDWVAREAGDRPWVVNLSVGRHGGPHTGLTLVEQGIDALLAAAPGRAVVQSTGNYYAADVHASGQLRPGQERTLRWRTDRADVTPNELEVWYPGVDVFEVEVRSPGGEAEVRVPLGGQASILVGGREAGRVYHRAKDPGNGDNHIDIFLYPQAPAGGWQVVLRGEDVVDGRFHAWVERDPGCPACQSRLDPGDADQTTTTGTIANGFRSIAVGAYDAHSADRRLAPFSSAGPTRDGRIKPDLLAPGVRVLAARSASLELGSDTPLLTRNSGTSMAAPHVTGTVALMFGVAPRPLTIQETRKLLLSTAREARFDSEPAARLGSGYLDIERAVEAARSFASPAAPSREAVEDFSEILERAAREPEPAWIGPEEQEPEELEAFDDGGTDELETEMELEMETEDTVHDERDDHPCRCGGHETAAETLERETIAPETAAPRGCGCRGADREEREDETSRWEPEWEELGESGPEPWESAEAAAPDAPHAPYAPVPGWWTGALSPATLFDGMTAGGALRRHLESAFEVLALPGGIPLEAPRQGDLVVRRALGEGSLAFLATVGAEDDAFAAVALDPAGRMPFDQLLVRPRTARPASRQPTEIWELSTEGAHTCKPGEGPPAVLPDPEGKGLHPLVLRGDTRKRSRNPTVGDAQELLNRFLDETKTSFAGCPKQSSAALDFMNKRRALLRKNGQDPLDVDCRFGPNTETATQIFQTCAGIEPDGKIGPITWGRLERLRPGSAPASRPCCILAPTLSPFGGNTNLVDPAALGAHGTSSEAVGLIYARKAGFLDLGHIRDLCDLTKSVLDQIVALGSSLGTVRTTNGFASLKKIPAGSDLIKVARAISLDDGLGHEISSYSDFSPGGHNSAFSPEDLCSNFLGTLLAERAVAAGGAFNDAVDTELDKLVRSLDGQTVAESRKAFDRINGRWVVFSGVTSLRERDYLRRRNFEQAPFMTGDPTDGAIPAFVTDPLGDFTAFYDYFHTEGGGLIPRSGYPAAVAAIKTDARSRYGDDFDKPS